MRIAYIASGAAGMYCGSCLHDNTLGGALSRLGHEVALLPTYTPIRTDEEAVAQPRIFYGAVNVYLQQVAPWFRSAPGWLHRLLDRPSLLSWVGRFAGSTDAHQLGALTESVLAGEHGHQAHELELLVAWLKEEFRPEVVHLTNSLFLGMARRLREELGVPVVVGLAGEDLFLDGLIEPYQSRVRELLRERAKDADAFLAPSRYYAGTMSELLAVPAEKIAVVPLGLSLTPHLATEPAGPPKDGRTLGFFARLCPEKGLHLLVDAFRQLAREPGREDLRLCLAGYLGPRDRAYVDRLLAGLAQDGLSHRCELVGEVDLGGKIRFLRSLDVMALPTVYQESKGLSALEAMANGVPVVLPRHGSFPEMMAATDGGLLVDPHSVESLARGIATLLDDAELARRLGEQGREAVAARFGDREMALATAAVYRRLTGRGETTVERSPSSLDPGAS
ncbi:MAG: glycosyltransferase family 4 protein [Thermoanaerobaculia bacterium]